MQSEKSLGVLMLTANSVSVSLLVSQDIFLARIHDGYREAKSNAATLVCNPLVPSSSGL